SSFMGMLSAVGPGFDKLGRAAEGGNPAPGGGMAGGNGRVHVVESNKETVRLGVFDATLPPILTIESGDWVSFPNTWSHFMNELQPGVPISRLAELRSSNPGRGPHSIIGPIAVKDAEPGDVVEIRYKRLHPATWGAVFNNPAALSTGLLPQDFSQGQIKYVDLDLTRMEGKFAPDITIPLTPFQGTLGGGAARRVFPAAQPWGDEFGAARPAWRQSRPARADRRLDPLPAGVEAGRSDLHRRLACRAGRRRD